MFYFQFILDKSEPNFHFTFYFTEKVNEIFSLQLLELSILQDPALEAYLTRVHMCLFRLGGSSHGVCLYQPM